MPLSFVRKAKDLFAELIATADSPVLVHGDLHHDNVLSSNRAGWLASDPKGIFAEPCYETAAMIRNPYEKLKDQTHLALLLKQRIQILSRELDMDPQRILKYAFAQTVLSAVWNYESAKGADHQVRIAHILDTLEIDEH